MVSVGTAAGLSRRELFVDARDVSTNDGEIGASEYNAMLAERGNEKLAEHIVTTAFSGQVEPAMNYKYKEDYFLGDIVQIETEYGVTAAQRITEMIECEDENGLSIIPTFEHIR
jgi:hypothetical protein